MTVSNTLMKQIQSHPACEGVKQASGAWTFAMRNGRAMSGTAVMEEEMAVFRLEIGKKSGRDYTSALRINAQLAGGARLAIDPAGKWLALADSVLPDGDDDNGGARIRQALDGIKAASESLCSKAIPEPAEDTCEPPGDEIVELLAEAGWEEVTKLTSTLQVRLRTEDYHVASAFVSPPGTMVFHTGFPDHPYATAPGLEAASLLLLKASAATRLIRPALRASFGLEAAFETRPTSAEAGHALNGLSTVCGQVAREVKALLQDEELAEAYLLNSGG